MNPAWQLLIDLFTGLPNVMFCLKDREGRYVAVNQAFADRTGRPVAEIVGLRAADLFPAERAAAYDAQDAELLASGEPLRNELELIEHFDGTSSWYLTTKVATTEDDEPTGIAGVSVDLDTSVERGWAMAGLAAAVQAIRTRFAEPLRVDELAAAAQTTAPQLERQVRRVFGLSVKQFVLRTRLEEAIHLLKTTKLSISDIAARCGYYDQAAFTRQFKRVVGLTPGRFRGSGAGRRPGP